jgi:hypothetical protein
MRLKRTSQISAQAIVEFAVVLPLLLVLLLGLINLGVLVNAQIILTQAAWEGARAGAILNVEAEEADARIMGAVRDSLAGLSEQDKVFISIDPDQAARGRMTWPLPRGEALTVSLKYPLRLGLPFPATINLSAQATSRIEYSNPP